MLDLGCGVGNYLPSISFRAAQVVGVKEYLEDLAKKQTFFRDAAGNSRVGDTGHKWAKVKFGEFTKEAYDEWRAKGGKKLPNQMY